MTVLGRDLVFQPVLERERKRGAGVEENARGLPRWLVVCDHRLTHKVCVCDQEKVADVGHT